MSRTYKRLSSSNMSDLQSEQSYLFQQHISVGEADRHVHRVSALVLCFSSGMNHLTSQKYLWLVLQCRENKAAWRSRRQGKNRQQKCLVFCHRLLVWLILCFSTPHFQSNSCLVTLTSHKHSLLLTRNVDWLTEMNLRMSQR